MTTLVIETPSGWMIRCRVCQWHEYPKVGKPKATWTFNGNRECPTFTPSMNEAIGEPVKRRCHFTVTDGKITYQKDCTHELAEKTLPLEPWPQAEVDYCKILLEGAATNAEGH